MTPRTPALALPAALFFALFYFLPLAAIAQISFTPGLLSQGDSPLTVFRDPAYVRVLGFSTWQAMLSTLLTLLAGLPAAYAFARFRFPAQSFWRALATVPFVIPTVVVAAAFTALLGPRGVLSNALVALLRLEQPPQFTGTLGIILLAHVFFNVSVVIRVVGAVLGNSDPAIDEAAQMDGAGLLARLRHVSLPLALPSIAAAAALVFLFTFTSFGVVLLLGDIRHATIEVSIYRQTAQLLRLDVATSLALLQLLVTLVLGAVSTRLQDSVTQEQTGLDLRRVPRRRSERLLVLGAVLLIALLMGLPLISLAARSLAPDGELLRYYAALNINTRDSFFFVPPLAALGNSLGFAALTVAFSTMLGLPLAYALAARTRLAKLGEALLLLPIGTSAVTLGLGFFVAFDTPLLDLRTSPLLMPIAHTMIALPFFVRAVLPALRALDPQLRESAATEGATRWQITSRIDFPLLAPTLAAAALFAFSISMGEFGASLLLSRPEFPTVPVAIFRFLGQPGALNYGQAMAMSTILMLVTATASVLSDRFGR